MKININLLPWREAYRLRMNKYLFVQLFSAAILGIIFILFWGLILDRQIFFQELRNGYLESHLVDLNSHLLEIKDMEVRRKQIIDRIALIEALQNNREIAVRIFDQIVYTTPEGIFYKNLERHGNILSMKGFGGSSDQISTLMRRLDASAWLHSPVLDLIESKSEMGSQRNAFNLSVHIEKPKENIPATGT